MKTLNTPVDVRQHILETAQQVISTKGYSAVGLNEILKLADLPKGSFYYYFKSKDAFGEAMLQNYFEEYLVSMDKIINVSSLTMAERLINYFEYWLKSQESFNCQGKCLAVKLAAEVADLSESMRLALKLGTTEIIDRLNSVIARGIEDGSLAIDDDSNMLAQTLYQMWLGASLMAKINRSISPINNAMETTKKMLRLE